MSKEPLVLWLLGREIDIEALVRMKTLPFFPLHVFEVKLNSGSNVIFRSQMPDFLIN